MMEDRPADKRFFLLRHPIIVGSILFVVFFAFHVIAEVAFVVLLGFLAVLLAVLISYPLDLFDRFMPRPLALALTIVLVAGVAALILVASLPVLAAEAARFADQVPVALSRVSAWWDDLRRSGTVPELPGPSVTERLFAEAQHLLTRALPFAFSVGATLVTLFAIFVLSLFLAYAPESYREGLRALVPREDEPLLDEGWRRIAAALRGWVTGVLISMLTMGVLAAIGLYLAGIDGWFLLAILTFFGTFVPYVGAIASAVPGLLVGLSQSPRRFAYALLVYAAVHLIEGYVVSPVVMRYSVRLRPGVLLFWQLLVAAIFGVPGVIVATPLLVCAEVAVGYFYVERRLGKSPPVP